LQSGIRPVGERKRWVRSGHHEIRRRGANRWMSLWGHDRYRLNRAANRSADHECDLWATWLRSQCVGFRRARRASCRRNCGRISRSPRQCERGGSPERPRWRCDRVAAYTWAPIVWGDRAAGLVCAVDEPPRALSERREPARFEGRCPLAWRYPRGGDVRRWSTPEESVSARTQSAWPNRNARYYRRWRAWPCSRDHHAELAQQAAQGVQIAVTRTHPLRAQAMQRQHLLLLHAFDRHRTDLIATRRFDQCSGIGPIGLVTAHVLRRQQLHRVAMPCNAARPVVGAATGFHQYAAARTLHKERGKPGPIQSQALSDLAPPHRQSRARRRSLPGLPQQS